MKKNIITLVALGAALISGSAFAMKSEQMARVAAVERAAVLESEFKNPRPNLPADIQGELESYTEKDAQAEASAPFSSTVFYGPRHQHRRVQCSGY